MDNGLKECRRFTQRDIQPYGKCGVNVFAVWGYTSAEVDRPGDARIMLSRGDVDVEVEVIKGITRLEFVDEVNTSVRRLAGQEKACNPAIRHGPCHGGLPENGSTPR